jgi:ABC-type nitrate/sulfonate/bicarbonate transport system permease component
MSEQRLARALAVAAGPGAGANTTVLVKIAGGIAILALWEIVARSFAAAYVARPSGILRVLPQTLGSAAVLRAAAITLGGVTQGLILAVILGTVVGLLMGSLKLVERLLRIYVNGLYAMPMIAIVPLLTIWFGYTGKTRLAAVVFAAFFPIAMNVSDGARSVPGEYLEVARSCRARPHHVWFGVTLPSSLPYLLAGLRLAVGRALVGAVVAEFFVSVDGLGFYILFQSRTFHHNQAFVAVLLLAAFALGIDALIGGLTRRYLPWYRTGEGRR